MAEERVQRRLAAILAADVVGYSHLMGQDEVGTLARLKALREELLNPKVAEYGGRIVKTIGDGTLIEFPSAVDAVNHAVDVQRSVAHRNTKSDHDAKMELRIGINVGDVIFDSDDIFGDGVNVAARLEALADPGGIYISGTVYDQVRGKLDLHFRELGEQSMKNIAEPIRVIAIEIEAENIRHDPSEDPEAIFRRPVVAVLPFENLSDDSSQEYFADGLTEDIITALSLWKSFPVIARNSTFAFKGQSPDVRVVGETLGARYVIEGSVRSSNNRIRVTAQLIDAPTGHHLWAERYDRDLKDVFALQDEIAHRIAGIVAPELERAEFSRRVKEQPTDLEAWDLCLRGRSHLSAFDPTENERARNLFTRAADLDPRSSEAFTGLARCSYREILLSVSKDPRDSTQRALQAAQHAVELDRLSSNAHMLLAIALQFDFQLPAAASEGETAVQLNPSNAQAYFTWGFILSQIGRPTKARQTIETGFRLNPHEPGNHVYFCMMAHACFTAGDYEPACEWSQKAYQLRPSVLQPRLLLASSLGHLGREGDAKEILAHGKAINPAAVQSGPWFLWQKEEDTHRFLDGLRKAGWEG